MDNGILSNVMEVSEGISPLSVALLLLVTTIGAVLLTTLCGGLFATLCGALIAVKNFLEQLFDRKK